MHDMEDTHVLSMCMAPHCNLPPLRQWVEWQGVEVASMLAANARFDVRPRHGVSQRIDPRTSVEAAMLQCMEWGAAVPDDRDILPSFGGSEVPLACQGATRRRADRQAPSEDTKGTVVEPDGSPAPHGGNPDFFTFRRGMDCAVCRQSVRIWCNTCLVRHTCFVKDPRPCGEAVVQVVDDAAEAAENNSEEEAVSPRKSDPKRALARAQAKLVCAGKAGTLRDWTRARFCDCLASMGVKVPNSKNRREARDTAMQQALPLLAKWTLIGSPQRIVLPVRLHLRAAHNHVPKCRWITWTDSLMNDSVEVAMVLCFCMLAAPMPMFSFSAGPFIH